MAINKNHEFEELNGIKCSIVEKNCSSERVSFLKELLEWNNYTVVVVDSPAPKAAPAAAVTGTIATPAPVAATADELIVETPPAPLPPTSYTVGITDLTFNAINAIFGRILKTKDNRIVTQAYWKQQVDFSNDEIPYFEMKKV
ncbi:MAG: hypothetical protein ACXWV5_01600 [Flavitalea sp.]